jgi:hypothetical protein
MYKILSPDNFDISWHKQKYTKKEIAPALKAFADSFKTQGYYSQVCYNGYRRQISIAEIPDYCTIIKI